MARIFEPVDLQRAARPRGLRPEQPVPFGNGLYAGHGFNNRFGPTPLLGVNEVQVMGLPGAWYCVNKIANGVASMAPLEVVDGDGTTSLDTPPICARPNAMMTNEWFWTQAVASAVMRGNFIGILADLDPITFYPRQVIPVPPDVCQAYYDDDGFLQYTISGVPYHPDDVLHVPGFTLPGVPWGFGMVETFRRGLGAALEQQHMAADTYHSASVPPGVLTVPRPRLAPGEAEGIQGQWTEAHGSGTRVPAVLPQGWDWKAITWSPEDAQFLESRQFSVAELALMAGMDPSDLGASLAGASNSITYANVEQREISRVQDVYGPWMRKFEQAWSDVIPADSEARFVPARRFRLDAKTEAEVHEIRIASKVETPDEARKDMGRPPLTAAQKKEMAASAPPPPVAGLAKLPEAPAQPAPDNVRQLPGANTGAK
jgi:HK97 family phage portal protein